MKKKNMPYLLLVMVLVVLVIGIGTYFKKQKKQEEIANAYFVVNRRFIDNVDYYIPFEPSSYTPDGVHVNIYLSIYLYGINTSGTFTYEDLVEYFSQEYEEDGSLRLYNNGLHPEMEAYIEWRESFPEEAEEYRARINSVFAQYFFAHRDEGFENISFHCLSREMLDELIKKEADPEYEMDLMSIQQRERAEAEAQEAA